METISPGKHPRKVSVTCSHCGDSDQINDRSRRRKKAEGQEHLCRMCRSVQNIKITEADRNYWTKRFTEQQLNEMVGAILG